MKRLLLPTDFSLAAWNACQYAAGMLNTPGGELCLVHAWFDPIASASPTNQEGSASDAITDKVLNAPLHAAKAKLKAEAERLQASCRDSGFNNITIRHMLVEGEAETAILFAAREQQANAIVMGTQGADSLFDRLFGTVTSSLISNADRPVFAIPDGCEFEGFNRVTYATGPDVTDATTLSKLEMLLRPWETSITCVHVSNTEEESGNPFEAIEPIVESNDNIEAVSIEGPDVAERLEQYVQDEAIDLLVYATHHRSTWNKLVHPSLTRQALLESPVPILALQA